MDLRITKTRTAVKNAFLELRAEKPVEKITVKELSAMANINKATFYLHYKDIYDLSETLERELIRECLNSVPNACDIFEHVSAFVRSLSNSVIENEHMIKTLFNGSRSSSFADIFIDELYLLIGERFPEYTPTLEDKMKMTFLVEGTFHTFFKYSEHGIDKVLDLLEEVSAGTIVSIRKK
ncbi:MAG: TetR/AcrR family transcriptional regulator [Ruminococcus sp.]|nr:TetR/AcrR family transcriptional regulator [Ruminococcus sp.]